MKSPLAAAVVLACALMGNAHARAFPRQDPVPPQQTQPAPTPPTNEQPKPAPPPEAQQTPVSPETNPGPAPAQAQPQAQPEASQQDASKKPETTTAKPKKRTRRSKKPAAPSSPPTKTVVRNGSTPDPTVQLSPRLTDKQQAQQKQTIANLLAGSEANLQKLSARQLKASEQDQVKQIRVYMDQAKQATDTGDLQRAQNLASKARLLSDELVSH
jgi:hypothetical protein